MSDKVHLDFAALHFSTRCEAKCTFCYSADPLTERVVPTPLPEIEKILSKLSKEGVSEVLFVGGDPVVHPQFLRSLEIAKEVGLKTSVLSNTWGIKPEQRFRSALSLIDTCEATVLGCSSETHDSITQRPGSFSNLMGNLQRICDEGKTIGVCANAMPQNLREIYDMVASLRSDYGLAIHGLMIQRIVPSGSATGTFKFGLNLDDVEVLMNQIDRVATEFGLPIFFEDPVPWCTVSPQFHKYLSKCQWGYTRGSVSSTGALNRCGADDHYRLGTIWDGHVQEVWRNHPILESFRSKKYLPSECQTCELLPGCGGGCPLSCGTFKDHDVDQLYIQRKQLEHAGQFIADAPSGKGFDKITARFAYAGDLPQIVALEEQLFPQAAPLFKKDRIADYYEYCPQAFRVVSSGDTLLGYSVIYPLTADGVAKLAESPTNSILELELNCLAKRISIKKGIFIEVIAVTKSAPRQAAIALLRDALNLVREAPMPAFACPITPVGKSLLVRSGFRTMRGATDAMALNIGPTDTSA